ncbi:MAG TPA: DUF1554 domain-containing protein [Turneriella sp.]|nr:DUF1554 domain-containing protein [Turneriella sp.]
MKNTQIFLPIWVMLLFLGCNNYSLLEKLENPAGITTTRTRCGGGPCRIFLETNLGAGFTGNFVDVFGADAKCQASFDKPSSGIYKALISDDPVRRVCTTANCSGATGMEQSKDWVLYPNQQYMRADGVTPIGMTNAAGIFDATLMNAIEPTKTPSAVWTGFALSSWLVDVATCNKWTQTSGYYGRVGDATLPENVAFSNTQKSCTELASLYCVEQ